MPPERPTRSAHSKRATQFFSSPGSPVMGTAPRPRSCHASRDREWVEWIKGKVGQGVELYLAEHDPKPGTALSQKVQRGIEASDAVLVFVTDASQASAYVHQEIGWALRARKPIIPLVQTGIPAEKLGMLGDIEHIAFDFTNPTEGRDALLVHLATATATAAAKEANDNLNTALVLIGALVILGLVVTSGS